MDRELFLESLAHVVETTRHLDRVGWGPFDGNRDRTMAFLPKAGQWARNQALQMAMDEGVHRGAALMLGLACALMDGDILRAQEFLDSLGVTLAPWRKYGPIQERIDPPPSDGLEDLQDK